MCFFSTSATGSWRASRKGKEITRTRKQNSLVFLDFSKKILGSAALGSLSYLTSFYFLFSPIYLCSISLKRQWERHLKFSLSQVHAASTGLKEVYMSKKKAKQFPLWEGEDSSSVGLRSSQSQQVACHVQYKTWVVSGESGWSGKFLAEGKLTWGDKRHREGVCLDSSEKGLLASLPEK